MFDNNIAASTPSLADTETKLSTLRSAVTNLKVGHAALLTESGIQITEIEKLITPWLDYANKARAQGTTVADLAGIAGVTPDNLRALNEQLSQAYETLNAQNSAAAGSVISVRDALNSLNEALVSFEPIKMLVSNVDTYYDTVMQSFEERYTRGMKTWNWVISALVVIFLNANVITIYKELSTDQAKRAVVLQAATAIQQSAKQQTTTAETSPQAQPMTAEQAKEFLQQAQKIISDNTAVFTGMGFKGPSWIKETISWLRNKDSYQTGERRGLSFGLQEAGKTIFGWFVMILLLSAGAPFWQDTLESLFGVKNLLRQTSGTKNVEKKSGEGQPKP